MARRVVGWGIALGALVAGCPALAQTAAPAVPAATVPAASPAARPWPHVTSDIPVDDSVRWGVLPNGMRYAIKRNRTPPGGASLRLRIDAGSMHEAEDQRGVAHFIEHLALNETRNLPEGELLRRLERAGLQFGADSNATTDFGETIFKLDLPRADAATIDTSLLVLREVAGEATFRREVVDHERGVILAEERARSAASEELAVEELTRAFPDDPLGTRIPIGSTEVIRTITPQRINDFYRAYYRPERAILVAVGDFDVEAMEAKIRASFGTWRGQGVAGAEAPALRLPRNEVRTGVTAAQGLPNRVQISWTLPRDSAADSRATRSEMIHRAIALAILNRRLERRALSGEKPFVGGAAAFERLAGRADILRLFAVIEPGGWRPAVEALEQEHRRLLQHGVSAAEIRREASEMSATMSDPISSSARSDLIVSALGQDEVYVTFETLGTLLGDAIDGATPERVLAAYRHMIGDRAPAFHLASARPAGIEGAALAQAWSEGARIAVAAPAAPRAVPWPYGSFGTPGVVSERHQLASVRATSVTFGNGVRLIVKPTTFGANEVAVAVRFAGGLLALPAQGPLPTWLLPFQGFTSGGTGRLDPDQLAVALTGKDVAIAEGMDEGAFILSGKTRTSDLDTQLQLMAAYTTDPGFRAANWDRYRALADAFHDQLESTPGGVMARDLPALLRGGDPRWSTPDRAQIAAMPLSSLEHLVRGTLATAPIEVIIVGDVDLNEAIKKAAATFGALPRRAAAVPAGAPVRFPAGESVTRTHLGRADQAVAFVGWKTGGANPDTRTTLGLSLLSRVFQLRLTEELRERQGVSYAPASDHQPSEYLTDYGYLYATVEAPPERVESFFRDADAIARSLRDTPVDADEMERARRPLLEQMTRNRAISNDWWLLKLGGLNDNIALFDDIAASPGMVMQITPEELQRLARTYLVDGGKWRLSVLPEGRGGAAAQ